MSATEEAVQRLAGELPDGWTVVLEVERGSGLVRLYDPNGDDQMVEMDDATIGEQLLEALRLAQEAAPRFP